LEASAVQHLANTKRGVALLEKGLVHLEKQLNYWREAGKEIGHKLGVIEERKRNKKEIQMFKWILLVNQVIILALQLLVMIGAFNA
jgi:hypothetical protein